MPFAGTCNYDEFKQFAPNAKVPCLYDDETPVWESLAICEYLADRHQGVWPADPFSRAWARCAAAEMHAGFDVLRTVCGMNVGVRVKLNAVTPALSRDIQRIDQLWSDGLSRFGGPFLAGDRFTAVDAFFAPVAFRVQTFSLPLSTNAQQYSHRLLATGGMIKWQDQALQEVFRDSDHEAELTDIGTIMKDFRLGCGD